jgi:hypothetical protein
MKINNQILFYPNSLNPIMVKYSISQEWNLVGLFLGLRLNLANKSRLAVIEEKKGKKE